MINTNVKKQYPVIRMPNGHPVSSTMYNRGDLHGVVYSNDIEFDDVLLSNVITASTVIANLNVSTTVSSNISSSGLLLGTVTVSKLLNSAISTSSNITADTKLAYNLLSSLITSSSVVGNITIPKLVNTSLVSTGTIVADLTVGSSSAIDADAQAFFDRVTTAGGTLTTTEKNAVSTLVVQMKADGIWTKMKAIYPMVGGAGANPAAACAQNLKSASFTGTFNGGFTYANTGVTGNGTSAYFNTNFNPITQSLDVANCHISAYTRQDETNNSGFGRFDRTTGVNRCLAVFIKENIDFYYEIGEGIARGTPATLNKGFHIVKSLSGIGKGYLNNVQKESNFTASGTFVSDTLWLCGLPVVPFATYYNQKETSFGSIGDGLTDTEASNFYTAVQSFQTSLNRQVN